MRDTENQPTKDNGSLRPVRKVNLSLSPANGLQMEDSSMSDLIEAVEEMGPNYVQSILFNLVVNGKPQKLDTYERHTLLRLYDTMAEIEMSRTSPIVTALETAIADAHKKS